MYQIRVHGRGGQGVATVAELIAWAAIYDGRFALALPGFREERGGEPVEACCRVDEWPVHGREPVEAPDAVLVLDASLLARPETFKGLRPGGLALVNSAAGLHVPEVPRLRAVPATRIALARTGQELAEVPMLGAFAAASHLISIEAVHTSIELRFSEQAGRVNRDAADEAYAYLSAAAREARQVPENLVTEARS